MKNNTYTTIKGLSDARRMPRLDKIRLGAKVKKSENAKEYPVELPFFLLPDEVAAIHGGKIPDIKKRAKLLGTTRADVLKFIAENAHRLAEDLPVMIPVEENEHCFPQAYKMYGGSIGLKCIGNGESASRREGITNVFNEMECPCNELKTDANPKGSCTIVANLQVILPDVSMGGVYQIDIGSINSIIDINSGLDYTRSIYEKATGAKRCAMVPLMLRRVPTETHHGGKKQIHFTCRLTPVGNINTFAQLAERATGILTHRQANLLPEPDVTDPTLTPADMEYQQPERITAMIEELRAWGDEKNRLKKTEALAIKVAIDENDDTAIEAIYNTVKSRKPKGTSAADVAEKLDKKPDPDTSGDEQSPSSENGDPGASEPQGGQQPGNDKQDRF